MRFQAGCVEAGVLLIAAVLWLLIVDMDFVDEAGRSYALRLLAQVDTFRGEPEKVRAKSSARRSRTVKQSEPTILPWF